jgi:hypothetical protein
MISLAANTAQSTPRYRPTPSPSTETARTRSSPSLSPASSISSAPTHWRRCANSPRATRACRRRRARTATRRTMTKTTTMTTMTFPISLLVITSSQSPASRLSSKRCKRWKGRHGYNSIEGHRRQWPVSSILMWRISTLYAINDRLPLAIRRVGIQAPDWR